MTDDCSFFNVRDDLKPLTLAEVQAIQKRDSLPFSIALLNFSGNLNVGMAIRSAVLFGAEKVFIIGKKKYDKRSTVGAHNYIKIEYIEEDPLISPHLAMHDICMDYEPVLIEQGGKDIHFENYNTHKIPPCFIFGCESNGIPKSIVDLAEEYKWDCVSIPQIGVLRSLNVSAAVSIVCYKAAMDLRPFGGTL